MLLHLKNVGTNMWYTIKIINNLPIIAFCNNSNRKKYSVTVKLEGSYSDINIQMPMNMLKSKLARKQKLGSLVMKFWKIYLNINT